MARPKKQEVDYFPHYCDHGKVLFILENHFKNDGYAIFYKLEELLGKTEGHCYDCSRLENWEYLLSKMVSPEEIVLAVIEKLSSMGIIDKDLWLEKRIWMQSFMDSISDAYDRRKVDLPTKPELMNTKTPTSGINVNINPQSKVKKNKVNKKKEYSVDFNTFYSAYPNKKDPDDAWRSWHKRDGDRPPLQTLLEAISKQIAWRKNAKHGEFRPEWKHPATWLRAGSWADEIPEENKTVWSESPKLIQVPDYKPIPEEERLRTKEKMKQFTSKIGKI